MGRHKPALEVGGRPIVERVLDAARQHPTVVVGTPESVPAGTVVVRESPAGGGPVAGIAAGLTALERLTDVGSLEVVGVLAGDLPFVTAAHLEELFDALTRADSDTGSEPPGRPDVALAVDAHGQANWLCAAWRADALRRRLEEVGAASGTSVRRLLHGIRHTPVLDRTGWSVDVDTPADLAAARRRQD